MDPLKKIADFQPTKKAFSFIDEFKNFAFKGNVIDLAVGVIIGAAFGKIVSSLVADIFMPLITGLFGSGETQWKDLAWVVNGQQVKYGAFLTQVIDFLIVAVVLFIFIVKFVGWIMSFKKSEQAAVPPLTKDQELLTEIRDLLKKSPA
jgi:large conductance mechanosensitive channel